MHGCGSCTKATCTCCGWTSIYVGFGLWTILVGVLILVLATATVGLAMTGIGFLLAVLVGAAIAGLALVWWKCGKKLCKRDDY
tara:strand:- start:8504 stop:8752 length:249 start_codon:yes stop_codon:yes gene_type:complete